MARGSIGGEQLTCVAAIRLDDGRVMMCSDSAVGYESGYRRTMQRGKWWDDLKDLCIVGESGSDFALSRVHHLFHMMIDKDADNADPGILAECVRQVQQDVKGDEGIMPIECELLFCNSDTITVVGGDGGVIEYSDFAVIGHGQPACNPQMMLAFDKWAMKRTEYNARMVLSDAFDVTTLICDSVCKPFWIEAFSF